MKCIHSTFFRIAMVSVSLILCNFSAQAQPTDGFVDISSVDSSILVEMRYFTDWNFMGHKSVGYEANKCFLTKEAAQALSRVQKNLLTKGYSLLLLDCYRPQRAVNEFVSWTRDPKDLKMQKIFYVEEPKEFLVKRQYIASRSGHSRGSTLDLTLVRVVDASASQAKSKNADLHFREDSTDCRYQKNIAATGQLDMGTTYDCFSKLTNTSNKDVSKVAQKNRQILKRAMGKGGFYNYPKEWWHYTLRGEPFPKTYFDFVVQ